jgi:hypothetical protein
MTSRSFWNGVAVTEPPSSSPARTVEMNSFMIDGFTGRRGRRRRRLAWIHTTG